MAKDQTSKEIEELLKQLKETTAVDAETPSKKEKKQKPMTDDDVKALLRKYYTDIDGEPAEKESSLELDTSDFVADVEEPEVVAEPEVVEEPEAVEGTEVVEDSETLENILKDIDIEESEALEALFEDTEETEAFDAPEAIEENEAVEIASESVDDEESLDEILYNFGVEFDDTQQLFDFEEKYVNTPVMEISPSCRKEDAARSEDIIENENSDNYSEGEPETVSEEELEGESETAAEEELGNEIETVTEKEVEYEPETVDEEELEDETEPLNEEDFAQNSFNEEGTLSKGAFEGEAQQEWKPAPDVSGRLDDGELDLMVALGLGDKLRDKYGEERVRRAEEKNRLTKDRASDDISAFAYRGREYTKLSDPKKIFGAFKEDKLRLTVELIGTAVFAILLFFFENLAIFDVDVSGIFDSVSNPSLYSAVSLILLILCATFSYRRIFGGILMAFGRKRSGNPVVALTFVSVVLYNVVIIIFSPADGAILYNFPIALGFLFEVVSDLMEYGHQRTVFSCLNNNKRGELYGFCDHRIDDKKQKSVSARKISFIEGYFRHMGRSRSNIGLLMIFILVAIFGALIATAAAVFDFPLGKSLSAFAAVFAFASPMSYFFCRAWQKLVMSVTLRADSAGVIGEPSEEQLNVDYIVIDDKDAFSPSSVSIVNVRIFDNFDFYSALYNVNSLFSAVGGPLSEKIGEAAENIEKSNSVKLTGAADHYVEALVDGKTKVAAGSYSAFIQRGYALSQDHLETDGEENATVMYAAVNGKLCARFCVKYSASKNFASMAGDLASEGLGVRIRTLDPNIDRGMLFTLFGENVDSGIIREPQIELPKNSAAVTAVFSRGNIKGLARAFVCAKRMKRIERAMDFVGIVQVIIGIIMSAALLFCGTPAVWMSVAATVMQLTCVIPAAIIYFLCMHK